MRGFAERADVEDVERFLAKNTHRLGAAEVPLADVVGRVLAGDVRALAPVPSFARSAMDGYALRGEDSFGASHYDPIALEVIGLALPGRAFEGRVGAGQAVRIMTGAPLPEGADAVVMAEVASERDGRLEVREPVAPRKNVGAIGEDVKTGELILCAGRRLRPQDAGLLAAIGVASARCVRRPRVALIVTGDELLPAGSVPSGHCIVDSNSVVLRALVARDGGVVLPFEILPDQPDRIRQRSRTRKPTCCWCRAARRSARKITRRGSSPSWDPSTSTASRCARRARRASDGSAARAARSSSRVASRRRAARSIRPDDLGLSASWQSRLVSVRVRVLRRADDPRARRPHRAPGPIAACACRWRARSLADRDASTTCASRSKTDCVVPLATSGASILSSTVRADGCVLVPRSLEGMPEGTEVEVLLYDEEYRA